MRKKKYENFIAKLMMTKDIIDAACTLQIYTPHFYVI